MPKTIKEVLTDYAGVTTIEYSDGSTRTFTTDDVATVQSNPLTGGIVGLSGGGALFSKNRGTASVQRIFNTAGEALSAGVTPVTQYAADDSFCAVQLFYGNWTATPYDVTTARVSPTPVHLDIGSTTTWTNVTFPTVTCPAGSGTGNNIVPGMMASNVIPVASVARTDDVSKKPLLQVRTYFAGAASGNSVAGGTLAAFNASPASNGLQYASRIPAGDATNTFTATQQPSEAGQWLVPMAVKFFYNVRSCMVATVGDSLDRGQGSTGNALGWPIRAVSAISSAALRATDANFAWSGQSHAASMAIGKQVVAVVKPDVLTFAAWSPNDTATQAAFDDCWYRTLEMIEHCRLNGVTPIIRTSGAVNTLTTAENARRLAQNTKVRALGLAYIIDVAAAVDDPANAGKIIAAFDSGDGLHYSDAGYAAIGAMAAPVIKSAL